MAEKQDTERQEITIMMDSSVKSEGNIWTDRLYAEYPRIKGFEVSEEEYQEWLKKEGYEH